MDKLIHWLEQNTGIAVTLMNCIIGLVVVIVAGFLIVRAVNKLRTGKVGESMVSFGLAALAVVLGIVGVVGVIWLGRLIKPTTVQGNNSFGAVGVSSSVVGYAHTVAIAKGLL